jgi:chemotaxis protein CheX
MSIDNHFLEFSKPFISATKNIFETMVSCKIEAQKPSIKNNLIGLGDVNATIALAGVSSKDGKDTPYEAMLVISFPFETYYKIAGIMLSNVYTEFVPEIRDLGAEITNMVMGNAKSDLTQMGYTTNNTIPKIIEGKTSIIYPTEHNIVVIPFNCEHGVFYMELCYRE